MRWGTVGGIAAFALLVPLTVPASSPQPFVPSSDAVVLARIATSSSGHPPGSAASLGHPPGSTELAAAVEVAAAHLETGRRLGDLRHLGYARAALKRWWDLADPPPEVRRLRARVRAREHDFSGAERDLEALVEATPGDASAWLDLALVRRARGDIDGARAGCERLAERVPGLVAETCRGAVEALSGAPARGVRRIRAALRRTRADATTVAFALGELGDALATSGDLEAAARTHRSALALAPGDDATLTRLADAWLALGAHGQVAALLAPYRERDHLLLRLALAHRALGQHTEAASDRAELGQRLDVARRIGRPQPAVEARYLLDLEGLPAVALTRAREAFGVERTPESVALLLRAARAAGVEPPAEVRAWLAATGLRDARIEPELGGIRQ